MERDDHGYGSHGDRATTSGHISNSQSQPTSPEVGLFGNRYRQHSYGSIPRLRRSSSDKVDDYPSQDVVRWSSEPDNGNRFRYLAYYLPFLTWMPQYRWTWLRGDGIAALTVASLYIPMCFSFAILANVDPISGLYAFVFHPLIYALLGSCSQMVVGPEATGSLLVGGIVRQIQDSTGDEESFVSAQISGVATFIAGAMLLGAGLGRLGFVDSVLSRPFMQGFISGVGFVLVVEQAIPELGLLDLAREEGVRHSSALIKLGFLATHYAHAHALTAAVSMSSLAFILIFRFVRRALQPRFPSLTLFPDRLVVVAVTAIVTWRLDLVSRGLDILGSLDIPKSALPNFHWPFGDLNLVGEIFSTSFMIALLGFFESSVTAKSLKPEVPALQDTSLSANRELIALGTANVVGGCFTTLPAFGGFGRSKLNVQTGGLTPMSNIFLSMISLLCVFFVLPYLYYVPKAVLSAMASAVGISMMEECPHDIKFLLKVRAWREIALMATVFLTTVCWSMSAGVSVGIILTLFTLVRHSSRSRIKILGRVSGNGDTFEDAELAPNSDQFDRCLIIRIPEPVTFANVGDLRTRLRRFEHYGMHADAQHPSHPRIREDDIYLIFDVPGLTEIDACGAQILTEIVQEYTKNGAQVIFCRLRPTRVLETFRRSGIVDACGGMQYFVDGVEDALRVAGLSH